MVLGERSKKTLKAHADIFRALSLIMLMRGHWSSQEQYLYQGLSPWGLVLCMIQLIHHLLCIGNIVMRRGVLLMTYELINMVCHDE